MVFCAGNHLASIASPMARPEDDTAASKMPFRNCDEYLIPKLVARKGVMSFPV